MPFIYSIEHIRVKVYSRVTWLLPAGGHGEYDYSAFEVDTTRTGMLKSFDKFRILGLWRRKLGMLFLNGFRLPIFGVPAAPLCGGLF
jgi:hypothetical protein